MVGPRPVDRPALARMTEALHHRGPDDEGAFVHEDESGLGVGLGFRRLAVIDLASGNQPLVNEDASIALVLNGEIYNFRKLRRELEARGHRFATAGDAEVVVHLYEEHGPACVERLNGMFAFALWDGREQELVLARDRFGKKPLHYAELGATLVFGSELKSVLAHPSIPRSLDHASLARYLALEYVPAPHTIFEGIRKLPGGHVLRWREGRSVVHRYWDLPFGGADDDTRSEEQYAADLVHHLRAAVRRRLVSDVPLGAFLSGGIDSSSIVALMVDEAGAENVKTFSIGFREASFDESGHARRVAAHFGTEHHEETFTAEMLFAALPRVVDALDEPFADPSVLPTYVLSEFTRRHVTVALGGDGADELLAGYPTFWADRIARRYVVPRKVHERVLVPLAGRLPVSTRYFSPEFKLNRFLRGALEPSDLRHAAWLGSFAPDEQRALLVAPQLDPLDAYRAAYREAPTEDRLERLLYLYVKTYLQDDILTKVDRASMACSLEVRAPFLDVEVADFLGSVPARLKLRGRSGKHLLKQAMRERLPPGIAERSKQGFAVPIAAWLKGELRELLGDELSPDRLDAQGLFQPAEVRRLVTEHESGRRDHRKQLWMLLVFQLWHRRWLESE